MQMAVIRKNSVITITGGTGSFGSTMARSLLKDEVSEIRIFSRDENKQDLMRNEIKDNRLRGFFVVGIEVFIHRIRWAVGYSWTRKKTVGTSAHPTTSEPSQASVL